ncbi:MAG: dienelactone hydrolase family protein [Pseudomonadales bacterium]|jgi:carboxymethylenebutenolidase|tara:strand:- start:5184 stop:6065 length:882 start_codon:yes stop_codon:yes gene_type:complete
MCDELTEIDNESFSNGGGALSRRDFSKLSAAAIMSLMFPTNALGQEVVEKSDVMVNMRDGVSDCYYVRPSSGKHPAVLMWPDIKGLRPAFRAMGKRLAMQGYSVLVVNPFYRDAKAPVVGEGASFSDPETRKFLIAMARKLTQNASMADARAYIEFLDAQDNVDTNRKVGTLGYCMGGPLIMRTAGAVPNRVGAAASFHGGGLVSDADDSPHLLIPSSSAHVLHAIAENDDERGPDAKNVLAAAYKAAGVPAEIEVYEGTLHGWCPPDSQVYNKIQAEKAWSRLTALFKTALA